MLLKSLLPLLSRLVLILVLVLGGLGDVGGASFSESGVGLGEVESVEAVEHESWAAVAVEGLVVTSNFNASTHSNRSTSSASTLEELYTVIKLAAKEAAIDQAAGPIFSSAQRVWKKLKGPNDVFPEAEFFKLLPDFLENVGLVRAWELALTRGLSKEARSNPKVLTFISDLNVAKFGDDGLTSFSALGRKWDADFPTVNPDGTSKVVKHHAVEQQVLDRYPGVITANEMQSMANVRGIPKALNSQVHLSAIRR